MLPVVIAVAPEQVQVRDVVVTVAGARGHDPRAAHRGLRGADHGRLGHDLAGEAHVGLGRSGDHDAGRAFGADVDGNAFGRGHGAGGGGMLGGECEGRAPVVYSVAGGVKDAARGDAEHDVLLGFCHGARISLGLMRGSVCACNVLRALRSVRQRVRAAFCSGYNSSMYIGLGRCASFETPFRR